jgi:hypothetical protein
MRKHAVVCLLELLTEGRCFRLVYTGVEFRVGCSMANAAI